ncbi:MAG: FAD-dependent oxidoreductase [Cyanobacteria bacterium SZAS LIN-2]|nr:FAD-dependent oxidoreductase [Cyanobacteria bacterium SZAS LIN-2]MBS2005480.1 FAD-dependent oxidoreductase [Cyanobacteria bacterium SZAS TMP-1]
MGAEAPAKKIVIVGGVAGGMSAAARARRLSEDSQIIVFERSGHVSYANCGLPYFIGGEIKSQDALLVQTPASLKARLNLDIRVLHEVIAIDPQSKSVMVKDLTTGETSQESYDDLILSTGAAPIRPRVPGIDLPGVFALRSIEDVETIQTWFDENKPLRAVVAGGGFIGLEMAEQLVRRGLDVTLIDGKEQVLAPIDPEMAALVHSELRKQGVKLVLGEPIAAFRAPSEVPSPKAEIPKSCWVMAGDNAPIAADLVILGLGIRPEVTLARNAGLTIGERGGIRVDENLQTSAPGIWAVGDAIEVRHPVNGEWTLIALGGPANRQGRIAANNILGAREVYSGTIGTAILRVFDLTVTSVGLNELQLKAGNIAYEMVYIHPTNHAGYYPGAERLDMKVLFQKESGTLLGAQVVGKDGVDKRIDVLATAIKARMTIRDLAELELAYAPPFGSAKDPINLAGMAGTNVLDGFTEQVHWHQVEALSKGGACLIDVRSSAERERGHIGGSIHIPLPELRNRLSEIPADKDIVTYCQSGQRSYIAYRILKQHGFRVQNLSGGYLTWHSMLNPVILPAIPVPF